MTPSPPAPPSVEVVRRWMEGLDRDGIPPLELCDEEITIGNVKEFMVAGSYRGRAGVRRWVEHAFDVFDDRSFRLEEAEDAGDGETVVTVQRALGSSRHTGLEFNLRWAAVWTVRNGRVVAVQGYISKAAALKALERSGGPAASAPGRLELAREAYYAYESGDRRIIEALLTDDFIFYSPPDPGIDRAAYFERCWPNAELIASFEFRRLVETGDEVVVTYEATKTDGKRFRNTEVLTFRGERICRTEVYFGWDLD